MPDAAGILPGGSCCQLGLALKEHDVGDAALGEMPRDAASHAPTADDDNVRARFHRVESM
jgi:hypothetical protein